MKNSQRRHGNYVFPTPEKGVFYGLQQKKFPIIFILFLLMSLAQNKGLVFPENVPKAYCLAFETLLEQVINPLECW